jgi:PAS domain S-box-containing protein
MENESTSQISDEELMVAARRQIFEPDILLHSFEDNPDGIFVVAKGVIEKVNKRAQLLSGYHQSELIGQPVEMLVPEMKRTSHVNHRESIEADPVDRRMGAHGLDTDMQDKLGRTFPVHVSLHPVQTRNGQKFIAQVRPK